MNEQFVIYNIYIVLVTALYVDRRIQNMLFIVFKAINNIYTPEYLRDLFRLRDNIKTGLRGVNKLLLPSPNTTRTQENPWGLSLGTRFLHLKIPKDIVF